MLYAVLLYNQDETSRPARAQHTAVADQAQDVPARAAHASGIRPNPLQRRPKSAAASTPLGHPRSTSAGHMKGKAPHPHPLAASMAPTDTAHAAHPATAYTVTKGAAHAGHPATACLPLSAPVHTAGGDRDDRGAQQPTRHVTSSPRAPAINSTIAKASGSHLDLIRAPYGLYGVKYIDLVSLRRNIGGGRPVLQASGAHLDLGRAPYGLYGVKYIDLVSLAPRYPRHHCKGQSATP